MSAKCVVARTVYWSMRIASWIACAIFAIMLVGATVVLLLGSEAYCVIIAFAVCTATVIVSIALVFVYEWSKETREKCNGGSK